MYHKKYNLFAVLLVLSLTGCSTPFQKVFNEKIEKTGESSNLSNAPAKERGETCTETTCLPDASEQAVIQTAVNECERAVKNDFVVEHVVTDLESMANIATSIFAMPTTLISGVVNALASPFGGGKDETSDKSKLGLDTTKLGELRSAGADFIKNNNLLKRDEAYYASLYNAVIAVCPNDGQLIGGARFEKMKKGTPFNRTYLYLKPAEK